jgi:hypothetical protein
MIQAMARFARAAESSLFSTMRQSAPRVNPAMALGRAPVALRPQQQAGKATLPDRAHGPGKSTIPTGVQHGILSGHAGLAIVRR